MNSRFDELTKGLAQSVTRRQAFKKFGLGLAGMALAALGLAAKAPPRQYCQVRRFSWFGGMVYTGMCMDIHHCVSVASADCPANGTLEADSSANNPACGLQVYNSGKTCSFTI